MYRVAEARPEQSLEVLPPQETEGVFLPDKWIFEHDIADSSEVKEIRKIPYKGTIESRTIVMEDSSVYRVQEGKPFIRNLKIPQSSVKTTAFLTKDNEGFNYHHQIKELEAGFSTVLISRELDWTGTLSQARTAHNILKIGKFMVGENDSLDPHNIQARGISRGGMLALGITALAQNRPDYDLDVFYFSATAPCYPRPFRLNHRYLRMPVLEATSLLYHISQLPLNVLSRYPKTIDADPKFAALDALALMNGDAGKFVSHMDPARTNGYVLGYPDDIMGMGEIWKKDFANFDRVMVDLDTDKLSRLFNGHLRAVSHHDMSDALKRQLRLAEEHKTHQGNLDAIDYNYISMGQS